MKLNRLASTILRQTWLLDPRIADGMLPRAMAFLNGDKNVAYEERDSANNEIEPIVPFCLMPNGSINKTYEGAQPGSIAIIPIQGVIMKEDYCGDPGTETLSQWTKDAYNNENIIGIIYKINSGGGSVEGTGEFAHVVKECPIPTIAWCDGLIASAAYWIGSSCDKIILSFETVEVGSIGTAISFFDNKEALAQYGYKKIYVNADSSPDKNEDFHKAIEGNFKPIKTNILNPTNDVFLRAVRANRAGKLIEFGEGEYKEPLTGNIYLAKKAIEVGLVDSIADFDTAVAELIEMSNDNSNKKNMLGNKFKKLSAISGKKAEEITEDEIASVNAEIAEQGVTGASVVSNNVIEQANANADALDAANEQVGNLTSQVEGLTQQLADANTKIAALGKKPGATTTTAIPDNETIDEGAEQADGFHSEADAALAKMKQNRATYPVIK